MAKSLGTSFWMEGGGNKKEKVLNGFLLPAFFSHIVEGKRNCLFGKTEFFLEANFWQSASNHTVLHCLIQQFLAVFISNFDSSVVHLSSGTVNIARCPCSAEIVVVPDAVADVALPPASWSPLSLVCQCLARPCWGDVVFLLLLSSDLTVMVARTASWSERLLLTPSLSSHLERIS